MQAPTFDLERLAINILDAIENSRFDTRKEIADAAGIHVNTINNYVAPSKRGKVAPSIINIALIAEACDVTVNYLIRGCIIYGNHRQ